MKKYLFLKKERFSIRKFSVGVASVLIGTSLFANGTPVSAQDGQSKKTVGIHYLNERELTVEEKQLLENFQLSHTVEEDDLAYYFVYRPSQKSLPNTGSSSLLPASIAGVGLLVVAVLVSRKKKTHPVLVTLFALGGSGILATTVLADSQLQQLFENVEVLVGGEIPQPKSIDGYEFTGYYYKKKEAKTPAVTLPSSTPTIRSSSEISIQPHTPNKEGIDSAVPGKQNDKGTAHQEPALPDYPVDQVPVETAKGDQTDNGSAAQEPSLPAYPADQVPVETAKGDQTDNGSAAQEPTLPAYPVDQVPVETAKGDQTDNGSAAQEPTLPAYPVDQVPVETAKGDQTDNGSAAQEPALPAYPVDKVPVETAKGDQSADGSAAQEPALPAYPADQVPPAIDKGTPETQDKLPEAEIVESKRRDTLKYDTQEILDANLEKGKVQVVQEGKDGYVEFTIQTVTIDGTIQAQKEIETDRQAPTPKIIHIGTKEVAGTITERTVVEIPFSEEEITDENHYVGDDTVVEGRVGSKEIVTTYKTVNGHKTEEIVSSQENILQKPQNKVITRGTKPVNGSETDVQIIKIPIVTRYEDDNQLAKGTEQVVTEGQEGEKKVETTYQTVKGVRQPKPTVVETITTPMKEKVIKRGSKEDIAVDKQQLQNLATEVSKLDPTTYTDETFNALKDQLQSAQQVLGDPQVTQEQVNQAFRQLQTAREALKNFVPLTEPIIHITNQVDDVAKKTVTLDYQITDTDAALKAANVEVYKGQELVQTIQLLKDQHQARIAQLDLDTAYEFVLKKTYTDGRKETTTEVERRPVLLIDKKMAFNDTKDIQIYQVASDGSTERITALSDAVTPSKLIMKLVRANHKDVYLPVTSVNASQNGFTVTATDTAFETPISVELTKLIQEPNSFTKFDELITAMKADPSGSYKLASDLIATDVASATYLDNFKGSLTSISGKEFGIVGLKKPLFATLSGQVENIQLKDVAITDTGKNIGALAVEANGATIRNIHMNGTIMSTGNASGGSLGGLVYNSQNATIENVSVTGDLTLNQPNRVGEAIMGGVIAKATGGQIRNILSDTTIHLTSKSYNSYIIGSVIGQAVRGTGITMEKLAAKGSIDGTSTTSGQAGAILGQGYRLTVTDSISGVNNSLGNKVFGGSQGFATFDKAYEITGKSTGKLAGALPLRKYTEEQAEAKIKEWVTRASTASDDGGSQANAIVPVDYTKLPGASADRATVYQNIAALLPFYDAKTIVRLGNQVDPSNSLFTKTIAGILNLSNGKVSASSQNLTQIVLRFADDTTEVLDLIPSAAFENKKVVEYSLGNGLLYTPENLNGQRDWTDVVTAYKGVDYHSLSSMVKVPEKGSMDYLFLGSSFDKVKKEIETILPLILDGQETYDDDTTVMSSLKQRLLDNKEKILLGLSHLQKLYHFEVGGRSMRDLLLTNPRFYGKEAKILDLLEQLGSLPYEKIASGNHSTVYKDILAPITGADTIPHYLELNHKLFGDAKESMSEWLRSASKATIVEVPSKQVPSEDVSLYTWLAKHKAFHVYLLPLLNLSDDSLYVTTNLSNIGFGIKDRYFNDLHARQTGNRFEEENNRVNQMVRDYAEHWARYSDMWYARVDDKVKDRLVKPEVYTKDGFQFGNSKADWLPPTNTEYKAIDEFFGASGTWTGWAAKAASAGTVFRTDGSRYTTIEFVSGRMLSPEGSATLSHELTHAFDQVAYFDGYGRRPGQDAESYALGLLESVTSPNGYYLGFNVMNDFGNVPRLYNKSNARFTNRNDVGEYMKGVFDVLYTLEAVEAQSILAQSKENQRYFFDKIELIKEQPSGTYTHANDRIRAITNEEWAKMNLTSINDLIDNNLLLVDRTSFIHKDYNRLDATNYYYVPLTAPIYGATLNAQGTSGGLQFRRNIFEMLAAKGWTDGFIGFASDKFLEDAKKENKVLSDQYAFEKVMQGEYTSFADFKKAKYAEHLQKAKDGAFKTITIIVNGKSETIDSYAKLKSLFDQAVEKDLRSAKTGGFLDNMGNLKKEILRAYHQATDDFRTSIYK